MLIGIFCIFIFRLNVRGVLFVVLSFSCWLMQRLKRCSCGKDAQRWPSLSVLLDYSMLFDAG